MQGNRNLVSHHCYHEQHQYSYQSATPSRVAWTGRSCLPLPTRSSNIQTYISRYTDLLLKSKEHCPYHWKVNTSSPGMLILNPNGTLSLVLEIGMWWLVISTWRQSQPQSKQQEAKRKQKAVNKKDRMWNKSPNLFNHQTSKLVQLPNNDIVQLCHHLPRPRKIYIADHLGLISIPPLMHYLTLMHLHDKTRSALVTHHYYCLGTSSNQPWWI